MRSRRVPSRRTPTPIATRRARAALRSRAPRDRRRSRRARTEAPRVPHRARLATSIWTECAPGLREHVHAAGAPHELGRPVAGDEQRVEPLDHRHARARRAGGLERLVHVAHARVERGEEGLRFRVATDRRADRRTSAHTPSSVVPPSVTTDGATSSAAIARSTSLAGSAHTSHTDWVSTTCGRERREALGVEAEHRCTRRRQRAHLGVDVGRRGVAIHRARGHSRQSCDVAWMVALVRHADELTERAEGGDDLGGGREERDDARRRARARQSSRRIGKAMNVASRRARPAAYQRTSSVRP